jgi:hypothetical protein
MGEREAAFRNLLARLPWALGNKKAQAAYDGSEGSFEQFRRRNDGISRKAGDKA